LNKINSTNFKIKKNRQQLEAGIKKFFYKRGRLKKLSFFINNKYAVIANKLIFKKMPYIYDARVISPLIAAKTRLLKIYFKKFSFVRNFELSLKKI